MNWLLLANVVVSFNVAMLNIGTASPRPIQKSPNDSEFRAIQVSTENENVKLPYTLNQQEVKGARTILAFGITPLTSPSGVIEVSVDDTYFTSVYIFDGDNVVVAKDVVAPGIKMELEFNAENSARAEVVEALALTIIPFSELKGLFNAIDRHKRFPELVAMYMQAGQTRDDMAMVSLALQIADDLAAPLLK